jgi:putative endonuclease
MTRTYFVYILTNKQQSVLYIGVTNDIERRFHEHCSKFIPGFSETYNLNRLVHIEQTADVWSALEREKQLKRWSRIKKEWLVSMENPQWNNLGEQFQYEDVSASPRQTSLRST